MKRSAPVVLVLFLVSAASAGTHWQDARYRQRLTVRIEHPEMTAVLNTACLEFTPAEPVRTDGRDIRVLDSRGTAVPHAVMSREPTGRVRLEFLVLPPERMNTGCTVPDLPIPRPESGKGRRRILFSRSARTPG